MKLRSHLASLAASAVVLAAAFEAKASCPNPLPLSQSSASAAITAKYNAGNNSTLLGSTSGSLVNPTDWGCEGWYQLYTNGGIWVSAETAAHVVLNQIASKFIFGQLLVTLGYPVSDQFSTSGGEASYFAFGTIYHETGAATANVMDTSIFNAWNIYVGKDGPLGYPNGDWVVNGTKKQNNFDNGFMITDSAGTRAVLNGAFSQGTSWSPTGCSPITESITRTSGDSTGGYGHVTVHCAGNARVDFFLNTASGSTFLGSDWSYDNTAELYTGKITNSQAGFCSGSHCFATIEARTYVAGVTHTAGVASFQINP